MTEDEYICISNLARVRDIKDIMTDIHTHSDEESTKYGMTRSESVTIFQILHRADSILSNLVHERMEVQ